MYGYRRMKAGTGKGQESIALCALAPVLPSTSLPSSSPSLASPTKSRAECWVEKAMIYQKLRDYRRACRELQQAVRLDSGNAQAWNILGLCSTSQGDIREGVRAYERAVEINPRLKEAWINMGQVGGRSAEREW